MSHQLLDGTSQQAVFRCQHTPQVSLVGAGLTSRAEQSCCHATSTSTRSASSANSPTAVR